MLLKDALDRKPARNQFLDRRSLIARLHEIYSIGKPPLDTGHWPPGFLGRPVLRFFFLNFRFGLHHPRRLFTGPSVTDTSKRPTLCKPESSPAASRA